MPLTDHGLHTRLRPPEVFVLLKRLGCSSSKPPQTVEQDRARVAVGKTERMYRRTAVYAVYSSTKLVTYLHLTSTAGWLAGY